MFLFVVSAMPTTLLNILRRPDSSIRMALCIYDFPNGASLEIGKAIIMKYARLCFDVVAC